MPLSAAFKEKLAGLQGALKHQLLGIACVVGTLWLVYGIDLLAGLFGVDFREWFALRPRQLVGLHGILTMPLVHGDIWHLINNTWGLVISLVLLVLLRPQSWPRVLALIYLLSGALTWFLGSGRIVGASGVVMGLVFFLIAPGLLLLGWWAYRLIRKIDTPCPIQVHPIPLIVSVLLGVFYTQDIARNLIAIPSLQGGRSISWAAHWCGAAAGLIVAFLYYKSEGGGNRKERTLVEESLVP